jgi:hypothetical protein
MISGWLIVLAALVLLRTLGQRYGFTLAGIAVEALGLVLLAQGYRSARRSAGEER